VASGLSKRNDLLSLISMIDPILTPDDTAEHAPEILERILSCAMRAGASDVHLQIREDHAELGFRLDGVLTPISKIPCDVAERICGRIKYLANLKTYQDSLPQDGRIDKGLLRTSADIRVATYPTVTGEKIVLRLFQNRGVPGVDEINLPADIAAQLKEWLGRAAGMLLFTGPAGSGKTTTIYACLTHLTAGGGRHIITVEDPVERILPEVMQTEVNEARGLDFARAARHLLRQDPQVLVIGEIRDEETARIALRAALTGHMILSTIHAGSCQGVLERLASFCPELPPVSASHDLILNQRLVRSLCPACVGKGCAECLKTGFRGRLPIVESLVVDEPVRRHVRAGQFASIKVPLSLEERARALINAGRTTEAEIRRVL
jgi:general secretion pathway protein E